MNSLLKKYPKQDALFLATISNTVSSFTGIPLSVMFLKTRKREVVEARQLSMTFAKVFTNCSLRTIGDEFGGKDHATVLHAEKTINNLYETDPILRGKYFNLHNLLGNIIIHKDTKMMVCKHCGSYEVEAKHWVVVNTQKILPNPAEMEVEYWCPNCQEPTSILTKKDYDDKCKAEEEKSVEDRMYEEKILEIKNEFGK